MAVLRQMAPNSVGLLPFSGRTPLLGGKLRIQGIRSPFPNILIAKMVLMTANPGTEVAPIELMQPGKSESAQA